MKIITWKVRCIDSATKKFFDRYLRLDWSLLQEDESKEVLALIESHIPVGMLKYRDRFQEFDPATLSRFAEPGTSFHTFSVPDYFEDEKGNGLGIIEVMAILSGNPNPILQSNPKSVIRLGPSGIRDREAWSQKTADTIQHFLQLIESIATSQWIHAKASITQQGQSVIDFSCPTSEQVQAVLPFFRQFAASNDEVCIKACNAYLRHIGDETRRLWVKYERDRFKKARQEESQPFHVADYSNEDLIKLALYGLGFIHGTADDEKHSNEAYQDLEQKYGRENLLMAINFACKRVLAAPACIYPVMHQDYYYWVSLGCYESKLRGIRRAMGR